MSRTSKLQDQIYRVRFWSSLNAGSWLAREVEADGFCFHTEVLKSREPCYVSGHSLLDPLCAIAACVSELDSAIFKYILI